VLAFAPTHICPARAKLVFAWAKLNFAPDNWAKRFNGQIAMELLCDIEKIKALNE